MGNRLAQEKSPYLLQHADNPVHWQAWNDESLAAARETGKPILLSVGYSACHWCHVMERESFEKDDVAAYLKARARLIQEDRARRIGAALRQNDKVVEVRVPSGDGSRIAWLHARGEVLELNGTTGTNNISNLVMMGMGEPLQNYAETMKFGTSTTWLMRRSTATLATF